MNQPAAPLRRVHLAISGRVQGVAYRASAAHAARTLGLSGWVRNRRDGSVEAEAWGPPTDVSRFVEWCRRGPPMARVDSLDVRDAPAGEESAGAAPGGFEVRGTL